MNCADPLFPEIAIFETVCEKVKETTENHLMVAVSPVNDP